MLGSPTGEITAHGAVPGTSEAEGLLAINGVFLAGFEDGFGPTIIGDIFVEGNVNTAEQIHNGDQ